MAGYWGAQDTFYVEALRAWGGFINRRSLIRTARWWRLLSSMIAEGATVAQLWQALCVDFPELTPLRGSVTFAVNREYVDRDHQLSDNDEVALIPPVSGVLDVRDRFRGD